MDYFRGELADGVVDHPLSNQELQEFSVLMKMDCFLDGSRLDAELEDAAFATY